MRGFDRAFKRQVYNIRIFGIQMKRAFEWAVELYTIYLY